MNATDINPLALPSIPLDEIYNLPECAAIYFVIQDNEILYVGQTKNLYRRWLAHHIWKHLYNWSGELQVAWLECSESKMLAEIEKALILHFKPLLNRRDIRKQRFTVTVPDSVFEDLEVLAETQGRPTANLAAFLIELGIKEIKESGEFPAKKAVKEKKEPQKK